jgi:DNA-binding CsgD family transcriptional regulator
MAMNLAADDANRLLALIGGLHDAATTGEIAIVCREGLQRLVPADICDLVVLAGAEPRDDRYLGTPGGYTAEEIQAVLAVAFEHPVVAHHVSHGDRLTCSVSDLLPLDQWRDTAFYALGNCRLRQDYEIATNLPGGSATGMAGLSMSRSDRDFDARERVILGYLRGPLGLVLRRSLDRERHFEGPPNSISVDALKTRFPQLTLREAEVLMWIVAGKRDSEIAAILGVRPATATTHVRNLLAKLGVGSRLVAAMMVVGAAYTRA